MKNTTVSDEDTITVASLTSSVQPAWSIPRYHIASGASISPALLIVREYLSGSIDDVIIHLKKVMLGCYVINVSIL